MEKPHFEYGDKISLNTGYPCDVGTFVRWENDYCVWRDKDGSTYKSPYTDYNITLQGKKTGRIKPLIN